MVPEYWRTEFRDQRPRIGERLGKQLVGFVDTFCHHRWNGFGESFHLPYF